MKILPHLTEYGELQIEEVFDFYDYPRLFLAKNILGHSLLFLSVQELAAAHVWLVVPVSLRRKTSLLSGHLDLRTAFLKPELVVYTSHTFNNGEPRVAPIVPEQIPEDWLPALGEQLVSPSSVLGRSSRHITAQDTLEMAVQERRAISNLILKTQSQMVEAPARVVGNLLKTTQDLVDALGQVVRRSITSRGAISPAILEQTQINASALFAGSFGLQLKAWRSNDLADYSLAEEALELFYGLLAAGPDEDRLSNLLHAYEGRVAGRFRALLEALDDANVDFQFELAKPIGAEIRAIQITNSQVLRTISIVTRLNEEMEEEFDLDALVVGLNLRTRVFEATDSQSSDRYIGKIDPQILEQVSGAEIGRRYRIKLRKIIDVVSATGEERTKWILVGMAH
jgi:hypothetical protein